MVVGTSPLDISVAGPDKINSNQQADYSITVKSNSLSVLKNLLLKVDYPFGFNLTSSNPKPYSSDGTAFNLGDLEAGGTRVIKITGILQGQEGEERVLKFTVGNPSEDDTRSIGTVFAANTITVQIMKSSIGVNFLINQNPNGEVPIKPASKIDGNIYWKNNLTDKVNDMSVVVSFSGKALDKSSITAPSGFYNSSENSITYDKNNDPSLGTVSPSDDGTLNFYFNTLNPALNQGVSLGNSEIDLTVSVYGTTGGNPRALLYAGKKILKISSDLNLTSQGKRMDGPFVNSGPFPPKIDQTSTYTITWTAGDSFNNISNAKVLSSLSPNVKWLGVTSPSSEDISYDDGSGQIVWNVGDMRSGVGANLSAKTVSFQVSVTPSLSQVGTFLNLINQATIMGTDTYSAEALSEIQPAVTTDLTSDSGYQSGSGKVIR